MGITWILLTCNLGIVGYLTLILQVECISNAEVQRNLSQVSFWRICHGVHGSSTGFQDIRRGISLELTGAPYKMVSRVM